MSEEPLIALEGITKTFGSGPAAFQALKGIDLTIDRGQFVAVMGPSGSGKSTTMNILGCLDVPTDGVFRFRGVEVQKLDRDQRSLLRRRYLGFVFQGFNLLARTTALENVELPLLYRGENKAERRAAAMHALDQVGLVPWRAQSATVRFSLAALALTFFAPPAASDELPTRTDIPADLGGVVLCPDLANAQRMLRNFHVANASGLLDLGVFFEGLEATGCVQESGPLVITSVFERRDIAGGGEGPFMLFAARRPSGEQVIGIIDEAANNRHPRTDLERWLVLHAPDGTLMIEADEMRA